MAFIDILGLLINVSYLTWVDLGALADE
jgi:hypothetical protein